MQNVCNRANNGLNAPTADFDVFLYKLYGHIFYRSYKGYLGIRHQDGVPVYPRKKIYATHCYATIEF